ncbi:MAG: type II toxin-antitoxin system RelE/ParE family toxin [Chloroflexi bacterium]|nr:type II toxin-antitoxin system RelE/ParE family toxin [Chloroflexota bacterium]
MWKLITRFVKRWMRREHVIDGMLLRAIQDLEDGLSTASLGSSLYKVRAARKGQGKSGGYRTLIVYRQGDRAIVVYGFKKSDVDNIADDELVLFRELATTLLALSAEQIEVAIENEELYRIEEKSDEE